MPDAETVEDTTVSLSFNIEVSDSFGGYDRPLHLDVAIRTVAFTHWTYIHLCSWLVKNSGYDFMLGNTNADTVFWINALYSALQAL